ncbi:hypothetical protein CEXT_555151 [Caerostris extrusa]|uniref:Uncharacterized protein n=1 Tax=Caerostris extrusa TaxID=172846 RepID=A0AAV4Y443_CAEEX|nr:hypothetical protein CEXT_555151 [Caerostris extrusa]
MLREGQRKELGQTTDWYLDGINNGCVLFCGAQNAASAHIYFSAKNRLGQEIPRSNIDRNKDYIISQNCRECKVVRKDSDTVGKNSAPSENNKKQPIQVFNE